MPSNRTVILSVNHRLLCKNTLGNHMKGGLLSVAKIFKSCSAPLNSNYGHQQLRKLLHPLGGTLKGLGIPTYLEGSFSGTHEHSFSKLTSTVFIFGWTSERSQEGFKPSAHPGPAYIEELTQ